VSGVFEENNVLNRVLDEVKNAENNAANTTAHGVYVSGVFEENNDLNPVPESIDLVQAILFPALALCAADGVTSDLELAYIQKEIISKAEFYGIDKKELEDNLQGVVDWLFHHSNNTALILNEAILCCERCAEYWNESKDFQTGYFNTLEGIAAADGMTDHIERSWLNEFKKALGL
jgi:tellurite resistance protein